MIVTGIEKINKIYAKVSIDYEYTFPLCYKEISLYNINVGMEIQANTFSEIIDEIVIKNAKKKALTLLKHMDRTEFQLRKKLSQAYYPEDIIEKAIVYVKAFGYIDDNRYASGYIDDKKGYKSRRMIENELYIKGINKDIIYNVISSVYEEDDDPEEKAIMKLIHKKVKDPSGISYNDKQKLIASLYKKGFNINKIRKILDTIC